MHKQTKIPSPGWKGDLGGGRWCGLFLCHRDNDFALSVLAGEMPKRICGLLKRVAVIQHRHDFPGFEQFRQIDQIGLIGFGYPHARHFFASEQRYQRAKQHPRYQKLSEDEWVNLAKTLTSRPPMPWFNLNRMSDVDLRAIYAFVHQLGPAGDPAPAYVPPDHEPVPPYAVFPSPPPEK